MRYLLLTRSAVDSAVFHFSAFSFTFQLSVRENKTKQILAQKEETFTNRKGKTNYFGSTKLIKLKAKLTINLN